MFDRYTESARRVIFYGRGEASEYGNGFIESEHLLVALLSEDREIARRFFQSEDAASALRPKIAERFKAGPKSPTHVDMPLSEAAKQVLAYAFEEAERLKDYHVAPAHLLLGLLRDKESLAAEILNDHGVAAEQVREYLLGRPALPPPPPSQEAGMIQMITGFWVSRAIYTAAKLGIADLLKSGPKSIDELATATASHPQSLHRMMRALASVGVFLELEGRRFATSPLSETLEADRRGSLRYFAMSELGQEHFSAWEEFPHSVRTGGMAFTEKFKQPVWEYYAEHPEEAAIFNRSMSTLTEWVTAAILMAYDFSTFHKIVDIGGGQGAFLTAMLSAAPSAHGVLFDAPQVIAGATRSERFEHVAGNFFESVPAGGDLYTLKMILHDWNDDQCVAILSNIRKAIAPGGKVVIVETVLGPGPDAVFKNFLDLNMMVMTGGCERTEDDYRKLLEKAGFKLNRVIPTGSPMSIVEAIL